VVDDHDAHVGAEFGLGAGEGAGVPLDAAGRRRVILAEVDDAQPVRE
jgi:hypothetical protein